MWWESTLRDWQLQIARVLGIQVNSDGCDTARSDATDAERPARVVVALAVRGIQRTQYQANARPGRQYAVGEVEPVEYIRLDDPGGHQDLFLQAPAETRAHEIIAKHDYVPIGINGLHLGINVRIRGIEGDAEGEPHESGQVCLGCEGCGLIDEDVPSISRAL